MKTFFATTVLVIIMSYVVFLAWNQDTPTTKYWSPGSQKLVREESIKEVEYSLDKQWDAHVKSCIEAYKKDNTGWGEYKIVHPRGDILSLRFTYVTDQDLIKNNHCVLSFYRIIKGYTKANTFVPDDVEYPARFIKEFYFKDPCYVFATPEASDEEVDKTMKKCEMQRLTATSSPYSP